MWQYVREFSLKSNIRVRLHNDIESGKYTNAVFKIGRIDTDANGMISIKPEFCNVVHSTDDLVKKGYPELQSTVDNKK